MNREILNYWENIIGREKAKIISGRFFDNKLYSEFPYLERGDYAHKKISILSELENTSNILIEFESNGFLTHDEVLRMIEISAKELISKNIPSAIFENISLMLDDKEDEDEDEWLDREIKHIEQILDSFKPRGKLYE